MRYRTCVICHNPIGKYKSKYCSTECRRKGLNSLKKEYYLNHKLEHDQWVNDNYRERRQQVLDLLGNKCAHCGISDFRVLQIDHINGNGNKDFRHYKSRYTYYRHILEVKGVNYQILCANCNWIKKYENGER